MIDSSWIEDDDASHDVASTGVSLPTHPSLGYARDFAAIYRAHRRLVYRIALQMLGDRYVAEDGTQEIFLKIWRRPDAYVEGNVEHWLVRVTQNYCIDQRRRSTTRKATTERETVRVPETLAAPSELDSCLEGVVLRAWLRELPARERVPIALGFLGGMTHEEIADATRTPLGTTKDRIRTGLQRLRHSHSGPSAGPTLDARRVLR